MVAVRKAIDSAFTTLEELFAEAQNVELEEVLVGPDEKTWRITLSFLVPFVPNEVIATEVQRSSVFTEAMGGGVETRYKPLGKIEADSPWLIRRYRTIELDRDSGDFVQLLKRDLGEQ